MPILLNNRYCLKKNKLVRQNKAYPWCPELEIINLKNSGKIRVGIDLQDWADQFSYHGIQKCDVVYKRAMTVEKLKVLENQSKARVAPFGPNFFTVINDIRYLKVIKYIYLKNILTKTISSPSSAVKKIKKIFFKPKKIFFNNLKNTELNQPPHKNYIFFQVAYYDWNNNHSDAINYFRLEVIRALKNYFGNKFIGGFYYDGILPKPFNNYRSNVSSEFKIYKKFVTNAKIVISTNGFGGSVPWKLVEYLKWGCAIVSEQNAHLFRVPMYKNTIQMFTLPEEVIDKCKTLISDENLILEQKMKSRKYFNSFIKPRNLMKDILENSFIK